MPVVLSFLLVFASLMPVDAAERRFRFDQNNVPGWAMMTSAERAEHHQRLLSFKSLEDCKAYMEGQRKIMEERVKERNRTLPAPRFDVCEQLKVQGILE
jgi:hypothetical protein